MAVPSLEPAAVVQQRTPPSTALSTMRRAIRSGSRPVVHPSYLPADRRHPCSLDVAERGCLQALRGSSQGVARSPDDAIARSRSACLARDGSGTAAGGSAVCRWRGPSRAPRISSVALSSLADHEERRLHALLRQDVEQKVSTSGAIVEREGHRLRSARHRVSIQKPGSPGRWPREERGHPQLQCRSGDQAAGAGGSANASTFHTRPRIRYALPIRRVKSIRSRAPRSPMRPRAIATAARAPSAPDGPGHAEPPAATSIGVFLRHRQYTIARHQVQLAASPGPLPSPAAGRQADRRGQRRGHMKRQALPAHRARQDEAGIAGQVEPGRRRNMDRWATSAGHENAPPSSGVVDPREWWAGAPRNRHLPQAHVQGQRRRQNRTRWSSAVSGISVTNCGWYNSADRQEEDEDHRRRPDDLDGQIRR